ncbi:VirB4 family type IV secretion system protein [Crossiella cryophila]|uniref:Type IV secretory pathway VirB4 component n=1 Tax=Crossiella cryophila TaxID=43355 RepID=A0A7W7FVN1_9PSEU|nr:conjugal transfer protein TraC [Crossiella cryophila]MBB4679462.1 type IV secretory pathway VirB4 component [Crossiella cryophila]
MRNLFSRNTSADGEQEVLTGPEAVEVTPRHLRLGAGYATTLVVTGYPAEVGAGWLEPLLCYPGRLDVALHIEPVDPEIAAGHLRTQRGRLGSSDRSQHAGGDDDPELGAAVEDVHALSRALARGYTRLFKVGLYLTVHAESEQQLQAEVAEVRALCRSLLLKTQPTSFRALQGWVSTLPMGTDRLKMRRTLDTLALATAFPFTSPDLPADPAPAARPTGILYGLNATSTGLVLWDRWGQDNYNSTTLARSGAGKSFFTKLEALRSLYDYRDTDPQDAPGVQVFVIDPEHEYRRLCQAVGGTYLPLGAPEVRLNPFDLPDGAQHMPDAVTRRSLFIHTAVAVLLETTLTPAERAVLDRAVTAAYAAVGITTDSRTWTRPAPQLGHLAHVLAADPDPVAHELATRLAPFVTGAYAGLFNGPTTHRPSGHLVAISLRDLPEELKPIGTLLALDAIWRQVLNPRARRRRLVIVDEAWQLMQQPAGARFLFRMAKSARKLWAGLAFVSQDPGDLLATELGQAIAANSATQVLLRQAPQAIEAITEAFGLSDGERDHLLAAGPGEALLLSGSSRVAFSVVASAEEAPLITTDPAELLDEDEEFGWDSPDGMPQ